MDVTKVAHACVRITTPQVTLVIDPGSFGPADATRDADVVLVTHQHADHVVPEQLVAALDADPELVVHAPADVVTLIGGPDARRRPVRAGEELAFGDVTVRAVGEWHAVVHEDLPRPLNHGYVVRSGPHAVYHPGDALTAPGEDVDLLLLPVSGPWLKLAEVVDFARAVAPRVAVPIHESLASDLGLGLIGRQLGPDGLGIAPAAYRTWSDGETLALADL
ncbi:beta-lactamase domain-containing protein [Beutenbergia cavernae DSM 12333]|uniref:Beta-lactamase domain-containing protein n=1 Tax=Beutenbergia cavernae (strain ATCC BAA-8 / DSM 12333 / CCUG 43141 / JCM 11478 / NBRC 16432 / NCIMB 13614 / HKI 0122) TaxID=471853 RepID=C5C6E5_BEUC1|nr:MBL fold metallo-hydrolase [Beutenbergia cavernae]ACQ80351.1 beta-lactamase domain-containing protein [Beutenbergia cavernae DSM 12333]